ncbi:hypothetical protein IC582_003288 [Cucumis melo]
MDVKLAFLNGCLEEEVYLEQPLGSSVKGQEDKVLKLKKTLYGLKQAPRMWNNIINIYFLDNGYLRCPYEHSLYLKSNGHGDILVVCLYVDDLIFTKNCASMFEDLKKTLTQEFEITDIRLMSYYLGIEVKQSEEDIFISQERYTKEILEKFNMINSRLVTTSIETEIKLSKYEDRDDVDPSYFKNLVGSLRYLTCTRLNILFWIGGSIYGISYNYSFESGKEKASLPQRYACYRLFYSLSKEFKLEGYYDSDWTRVTNDLKSTSGYDDPTMIHVDNKSAIALAKNPVFHDHSKHIDTRSHFIRDCISRKEVQDEYVKTEDQIADIFTKSLKVNEFSKLRTLLGVF